MGAAVQHHKLFLCVQDLTCPGASLVHSAGLAAHVKTVAAIEANSRQYVPEANAKWDKRYPGPVRHQGRHRRHVEADRPWPEPAGRPADVVT